MSLKYTIHRRYDGLWALLEDGVLMFKHQSPKAVEAHLRDLLEPPAPIADLPADPNAVINDVIAHIANTWGRYEQPTWGLDARVRHKPTGKLCVVRGYMAWTPPIVLYSLTEVDGPQLEHLTPLADIEAAPADALEDTTVMQLPPAAP